MKKILFFGPYSPPITGQSIAFQTVVDSFSKQQIRLIDTTRFDWSIFNSIYSICSSILLLLFDKTISSVYFTCSRSRLGAIKDLPLLFIAGFRKKKIINHLHGADFKTFFNNSGFLRPLLNNAYQNVDISIVLTSSMAAEFDHFQRMKIRVIPNFYPNDFEKYDHSTNKGEVVAFLSNLMKSKGIMDFLNAAKEIHKDYPNVIFKVAGDFMSDQISSASEIENEVLVFLEKNKNLPIDLIGKIEPDERYNFLNDSSIFVLPTYYQSEAFPLSIIEAMRCGNAIITTKHNYLPEIIKEGNGELVDIKDVAEITNSVLKYLKNPELLNKIQETNKNEAKAKYPEHKYLSAVREVLENNS